MTGKLLTNKRLIAIGILALITFVCFRYTLHNEFSNWDDDIYVTNDTCIRAFTAPNLKAIFTEDITKNNFHPLTMLSLAVNYHFAQLRPETYYLTNILIHIANVILVFLLFIMLAIRLKVNESGALAIAFFGALWFGIHPMHVESVSWIAERKDVLYTFFYLVGLITYLKFHASREMKWYWFTFGLFVLSCLSKPMAVVFPVSLLCLDFLFSGKLAWKQIWGKAPFFIAALICGAYAVYTQNRTGAIADFSKLTWGERTMYASYGFVMYVSKVFNPTYLSTFYPYPYRYTDGSLPFIYPAAPWISLLILAVPLFITYKYYRKYFNVVAFGLGFLLTNLVFVLQFISCGAAIMADRYSYVAYIGFFFMLMYLLNELVKYFPAIKVMVLVLISVVSIWFGYLCSERTHVWHNAETLLTDAIKKYPYRALLSYKWLGNYYMDIKDTDKALASYTVLTELRAADAHVYDKVGNIYRERKDYKGAMAAFTESLRSEPNVAQTYVDIAIASACLNDTAGTVKNYITAYRISGEAEKMLSGKSFDMVQKKEYLPCILQYDALMAVNPNNAYYYFYRGVAEFGLDRLKEASGDWQAALKFNTSGVSSVAAYNLSVACDSLGDEPHAIQYANMAKGLGFKVDSNYLKKVELKMKSGK